MDPQKIDKSIYTLLLAKPNGTNKLGHNLLKTVFPKQIDICVHIELGQELYDVVSYLLEEVKFFTVCNTPDK